MKKTIILLLLIASVATQAQFSVSINTGFTHLSRGEDNIHQSTNFITPNLFVGYRIGHSLTIGLTGGVALFSEVNLVQTSLPIPPLDDTYQLKRSTEKGGIWHAGAYARYDFPLTDRLALFANLSVRFGKVFSRSTFEYFLYNPATHQYDHLTNTYNDTPDLALSQVALIPGVSYRFNSHLSADLYLNLLQLLYTHSTLTTDDTAQPSIQRDLPHHKVTVSSFIFGTQNYLLLSHSSRDLIYAGSADGVSAFHLGITYSF